MSEENAHKNIPLYSRQEFLRNGIELMLDHDPSEYESLESGRIFPLFRSENQKANIQRLLVGYEQGKIYDVHRWPGSVADELVEEKARIITAEDLSADDGIEEYFYDLPVSPFELRQKFGNKDVFVVAAGLTYPRNLDPLIWEAIYSMHDEQAFDWSDPERRHWATKVHGFLREDLSEAATIFAAAVTVPQTFPLRIVASALQNTNRFRIISSYAIKKIPGVPPEVEMHIGRLNKLPLSSSEYVDLVHAIAAIKLHEFQDFIRETEGIDSLAAALYTGDDRYGKTLWNNYMQQEAIIARSTRAVCTHFLEYAKLSGVELTSEDKEKALSDVVTYFGSIVVRRVENMPRTVYLHEADKYMPVVDYDLTSPTIKRIVTSVGNNVLSHGLLNSEESV